jgi:hypothetical protein
MRMPFVLVVPQINVIASPQVGVAGVINVAAVGIGTIGNQTGNAGVDNSQTNNQINLFGRF